MLATIRNLVPTRFVILGLFGILALGLASCATRKDTAFIADPSDKKETALPWNEQQKWEREGEASALNQQRR